jgi:hypothetical protein
MGAALLKLNHLGGKLLRRYLIPGVAAANGKVLTKHAAQVATAKENGAATALAHQARFLAKVLADAGYAGMPADVAESQFPCQAIHATVAWAGAAGI